MTAEEKKELLAEILEVDEDEIQEDRKLEEFETWDSVAVLSVISVMNEHFGKFPHASEIRQYDTIGALLDFMKR